MVRVGGKVVIRDLEQGCIEISRKVASSKDEDRCIACFELEGIGKG
jgi:hypothetical protein